MQNKLEVKSLIPVIILMILVAVGGYFIGKSTGLNQAASLALLNVTAKPVADAGKTVVYWCRFEWNNGTVDYGWVNDPDTGPNTSKVYPHGKEFCTRDSTTLVNVTRDSVIKYITGTSATTTTTTTQLIR